MQFMNLRIENFNIEHFSILRRVRPACSAGFGVFPHTFSCCPSQDLNPEMAALADISSQVGDRACPHVPFTSHVKM